MSRRKTRKYPIDKIQCTECKEWKGLNNQQRLDKMINKPSNEFSGNGGNGSEDFLRKYYKCRKCRPIRVNLDFGEIPITDKDGRVITHEEKVKWLNGEENE